MYLLRTSNNHLLTLLTNTSLVFQPRRRQTSTTSHPPSPSGKSRSNVFFGINSRLK